MKPQRPYLLRALYEWIVDSDEVPYVLVDAAIAGVVVPEDHIKNDQIVLNLSPTAVRDLFMGDEAVTCGGRFGGRHFDLYLPMTAIKAIYARDTQMGMVFPEEEGLSADSEATTTPTEGPAKEASSDAEKKPAEKPNLRLV